MPNRLADETSPYLLQHKDNPVDWYPWSPEALERARAEDRPILLSVGYSACHWCHVMEYESFEDPQTAALMNEHFVCIKVDREERPDIDSIYMAAVQGMTGHGGWPMTVFLTPEGAPFYGGTYYPPEPRHGLPGFTQVLAALADAWKERRGEVDRSAAEIGESLQRGIPRGAAGALSTSILDRAAHHLATRFDARWGGFGGAPKFPQPMTIEVLLRHWKRTAGPEALQMAAHTLRRMHAGGMYDHVGGGFARYSVDARWLVPHFEKMLYDNALLVQAYTHAFQATGDPEFREVVEETLGFVLREMTGPEGGFYSAFDADSEGEEGKFYVWTPDEIDAVAGRDDGALVRSYYGVTAEGNFEGRNILHTPHEPVEAAADAGVTVAELKGALDRARPKLYAARAKRVPPGRDDKVLTSWNAMMLHAFADAARVFGRADYRDAAERGADFLLRALRPDGALLRTYKDGRAKIGAFLEDYALLADALVALYETTFDARWLREAHALAGQMLERFWDDGQGMFFDTARDAEKLVVRPRDVYDSATPSGNSAATLVLLRLSELTGEERFRAVAERVLASFADSLSRFPGAFSHLMTALDRYLAVPQEVAIAGRPGDEDTEALLAVVRRAYLPNTAVALRRPDEGENELIPLLRGRTAIEGKAAAYVCERFACQRPVTTPEDLAWQLGVDA
jgi:uncharacterized protein YyaL (SSP411 family)